MTELSPAIAARVRDDLSALSYDTADVWTYRSMLQACYDYVREFGYQALRPGVMRRLALETGVLGSCQWDELTMYGTLLCGDPLDEAADDRLPFCTRHRYIVLSEAS